MIKALWQRWVGRARSAGCAGADAGSAATSAVETVSDRPRTPAIVGNPRNLDLIIAHPDQMAAELLRWLQGPNGRTGIIPAVELLAIWREVCLVKGWKDTRWRETAAALRARISRPKQDFARIKGRQMVVYRIPAAHEMPARMLEAA